MIEINLPLVTGQIEAVAEDLVVDAVKTGMLLNAGIIKTIAQQIWQSIVVNPVMVSPTGEQLINNKAIALLQQLLIPQALISLY